MRSLKSVLVLIFSLAPLASSGSAASIQTIADLFTGEFDNNLQSLLTEKTDLPFQRLHYIHTQLNQEDSKNSEVEVYVEQSIAKSSYVYRQRIYKFIYKNNEPVLEVYQIEDPERFLGAHLDPIKLDNLITARKIYRAGCDVTFSVNNETDEIIGQTNPDTCIVERRGESLHVRSQVKLTSESIEVFEELKDANGNSVSGRDDQQGRKMLRARIFECWSVLRKGDSKEDGWEVSRNNRVHDQGGKFSIKYEDKEFDISLSQLIYGQQAKKTMKLGFHEKDSKPTFSYTWVSPTATNVGLNLGYLQAGCTH